MLSWALLSYLSGAIWGAFGYAINAIKQDQNFELKRFLKTVAIGVILSGVSTFFNVPINELEGYSFIQLLTILTDKVF